MLKIRCIFLFIVCFFILLFSGCTRNDFEVVEPPLNDFPVANEYTEVEITKGKFVLTKSFSGIIENNCLIIEEALQTAQSFEIGEKGIITFMEKGISYEVDAIFVGSTENNTFIIQPIDKAAYMPERAPAKFSVITYQKDDAVLVPKKAVTVLDENNVIILKVAENGVLEESKITIGQANETYYEVIDGIDIGDKVVVRKW